MANHAADSESVSAFFREMDYDFIGLSKPQDDEFVYKASDVLVQSSWELPIVIQWPQSKVNYEFTSTPGDISFGIVFVPAPDEPRDPDDLDIETVEEIARVSSNNEIIGGEFEVPCEGVVFFLWDNNFDWSAVKKISYSINVIQASFTVPDQDRSNSALEHLNHTVQDLEMCHIRHADSLTVIENNSANIVFLEDQVMQMEAKLLAKKREMEDYKRNVSMCQKVVYIKQQSTLGLGIRMLDKHLLSFLFTYLTDQLSIPLVSKYWDRVCFETLVSPPEGPEQWYINKINKQEIARLMFDIRWQQEHNASARTIVPIQLHLPAKTSNNSASQQRHDSQATIPTTKPAALTPSDTAAPAKKKPNPLYANRKLHHPTPPKPADFPPSIQLPGTALASSPPKESSPTPFLIQFDHVLPQLQSRYPLETEGGEMGVSAHSGTGERRIARTSAGQMPAGKQTADHRGSGVAKEESKDMRRAEVDPRQLLIRDAANRALGSPGKPAPASQQIKSPQAPAARRKPHSSHKAELLQDIQQIRTDQQLHSIIDYVGSGLEKIRHLQAEKKRVRKLIKAWNASYEKKFGHVPSTGERKGHLRELHEEYQQLALALRIRQDKVDETLKRVGLTFEEFEQLRQKKQQEQYALSKPV